MMRKLTLCASICCAWATSALTDCGSMQVDVQNGVLVDGCGRQRLFRGVNKVVKTFPYYPSVDAFIPGNSITTEDMALWESLGFNVVRLGVMMGGVMPHKGTVNQTYLKIMSDLTSELYAHGIYTLVDFHQDLLSEAFCADGVPVWAANRYAMGAAPFPAPVDAAYPINNATGTPFPQDCGKHSWSEYYMTDAVMTSFQYMYTNESALDDLRLFWTATVGALQSTDTGILFWALLNEPWVGNAYEDPALMIPGVADRVNLQPFFFKLAQVIRATENATFPHSNHIIMSESVTFDDFLPVGFDALPSANESLAALSFHYYELPNFNVSWQVAARVADAKRLRALPILTEFDIAIVDPWEPISVESVDAVLDACDEHHVGYIGWEYADMFFPNGSLASITATTLSRPFPIAIAGSLIHYSYAPSSAHFVLSFWPAPSIQYPSIIFINHALHYAGGFQASANTSGVAIAIEWHNGTGAATMNPPVFSYAYLLITCTTYDPVQIDVVAV